MTPHGAAKLVASAVGEPLRPPPDDLSRRPLVQSVGIAFRLCSLGVVALFVAWLASNVTQVPPDATAVVTRFGRIVTVHGAGLLLALPRPIDAVVLLPGPQRQIGLPIAPQARAEGLDTAYATSPGLRDAVGNALTAAKRTAPPRGAAPVAGAAGSYLTGDGGIVLLDASLTYRVTDPAAYLLAEDHVPPALTRMFRTAAVDVAAAHRLDDFLVVDQTRAAVGRADANAAVRDQLLAAINDRLRRLTDTAALGVEVTRIDLTPALPPQAKIAFDAVLSATQHADQALAVARTDATRRAQDADRERDRLLNVARATAAETVAAARQHTDDVLALAAHETPATRGNLLDQLYRARIAGVIEQIGQVTAVDARGGPRVILPGTSP